MSSLQALAQDIRKDPLLRGLQCYIVGGAVRDCLLGLPVVDRDWVVVGARPQELARRGFLPVGVDFPVFLHPHTKEEFALARTERKQGRGYRGFVFYTGPEVRLEDDLARRDLTINAMAVSRTGQLIDPFQGQSDIQRRQLRHVGPAFIEDPVRLLRLARFRARFVEFEVAQQTRLYAQELVTNGEVDALVPERVWQEMQRGLCQKAPVRMFDFLAEVGALARIMPELNWTAEVQRLITIGAQQGLNDKQQFELLLWDSTDPVALGHRVRAPRVYIDYALQLARLRALFKAFSAPNQAASAWRAAHVWQVLHELDALRRPERFFELIHALCCYRTVDRTFWEQALEVVRSVDAGAIARAQSGQPQMIAQAIAQARQQALNMQLGLPV